MAIRLKPVNEWFSFLLSKRRRRGAVVEDQSSEYWLWSLGKKWFWKRNFQNLGDRLHQRTWSVFKSHKYIKKIFCGSCITFESYRFTTFRGRQTRKQTARNFAFALNYKTVTLFRLKIHFFWLMTGMLYAPCGRALGPAKIFFIPHFSFRHL